MADSENRNAEKSADGCENGAATDTGLHEGHRKKLRERFLSEGLESFEDHNVLELLLFYIQPRRDTNPTAHRLIKRFGSVAKVFDAPYHELLKVDGVGEQTASFLTMFPQLCKLYMKEHMEDEGVAGAEAVAEYIANLYIGDTRERVTLTLLDNRYQMIATETIAEGSVNFASVNTRKIIEAALRHNATMAIVAHNHPAGFALPSKSDLITTAQLRDLLFMINVRLIDHIIVARDDYVCLASSEEFMPLFKL